MCAYAAYACCRCAFAVIPNLWLKLAREVLGIAVNGIGNLDVMLFAISLAQQKRIGS